MMAKVERIHGMSLNMPRLRNWLELFLLLTVPRLAAFASPFVKLRYLAFVKLRYLAFVKLRYIYRAVTFVNLRSSDAKETVMRFLMRLVVSSFSAVCLLLAPAPN